MILPVMTGTRVSVKPNSDRACFFTYVYKFSSKNINVEFWPENPGNIPTHVTWAMSKENFLYIENFLYLQKIFQKFDMKIRNFRLAGLQIFNKQENF